MNKDKLSAVKNQYVSYVGITNMLLLFSIFCIGLVVVRIYYSSSICYSFLFWNLALAWVPYFISLKISNLDLKKQKGYSILLILVWILFLPNGPYLITDIIHLRYREPIPMWYDTVLLSSFAWNGLLLYMLAVRNVHGRLGEAYSNDKINIGLLLLFLSCGYGIYLGRFLSFNSWDILSCPIYLISRSCYELIHPFHHSRPILFTLIFFVFLSLTYSIFYLMGHIKIERNDNK